jgi:hypothetical protein
MVTEKVWIAVFSKTTRNRKDGPSRRRRRRSKGMKEKKTDVSRRTVRNR